MRRFRHSILLLLLLTCFADHLSAQSTTEIKRRQQELERLRNEIRTYEKKLSESERKEKNTLERIDDLEKQSTLLRGLLRKLREEERQFSTDILKAKNSIVGLVDQLKFLKLHYAKYVRSVYKHGRVYDIELLFSAQSINQLYIRIEYLKRFSNKRVDDLRQIGEKKSELEKENVRLQRALEEERKLISEKTREEKSLQQKTSDRQQSLMQIRRDKKNFAQELERRKAAIKEVERLIAKLIEDERIRKEREAAAARERERLGRAPAIAREPVSTFGQKRGRLQWPVQSGKITLRFGNHVHPVLKTVTENTGIDISVREGSDVFAVAEGEVSVIKFIPGYGNVMIVNHYGGYRTVYAHLSDIFVSEQQRVREGDTIARSGESISGSLLHFEIWKDRDKQNPETWLARR